MQASMDEVGVLTGSDCRLKFLTRDGHLDTVLEENG